MKKYQFVGRAYWSDKTLTEFRKAFKKQIPPKEMKAAFEYVKADYKKTQKERGQ